MKKEILDVTCSWLSGAIPQISAMKDTVEGGLTLADRILFDKLYYVMENQDSDFNDWLKIAEKFYEDNEKKQDSKTNNISY